MKLYLILLSLVCSTTARYKTTILPIPKNLNNSEQKAVITLEPRGEQEEVGVHWSVSHLDQRLQCAGD